MWRRPKYTQAKSKATGVSGDHVAWIVQLIKKCIAEVLVLLVIYERERPSVFSQ